MQAAIALTPAQVGEFLLNVAVVRPVFIWGPPGIGKSALVAWLILWALSTMEDTKGVVTANTENQLKTKTCRLSEIEGVNGKFPFTFLLT